MGKIINFLVKDLFPFLLVLVLLYFIPLYLLNNIFNLTGNAIIKSIEQISLFDKESYLSFFQGMITVDSIIFGFYFAMVLFMLNRLVGFVRRTVKNELRGLFAPVAEFYLELSGAALVVLAFIFPLMLLLFSLEYAFSGIGTYGNIYSLLYVPNNTTKQLMIVNSYQSVISMGQGWLNFNISQTVNYAFLSAYIIFLYVMIYVYYATIKIEQ